MLSKCTFTCSLHLILACVIYPARTPCLQVFRSFGKSGNDARAELWICKPFNGMIFRSITFRGAYSSALAFGSLCLYFERELNICRARSLYRIPSGNCPCYGLQVSLRTRLSVPGISEDTMLRGRSQLYAACSYKTGFVTQFGWSALPERRAPNNNKCPRKEKRKSLR